MLTRALVSTTLETGMRPKILLIKEIVPAHVARFGRNLAFDMMSREQFSSDESVTAMLWHNCLNIKIQKIGW